jgi:hypothetical protein
MFWGERCLSRPQGRLRQQAGKAQAGNVMSQHQQAGTMPGSVMMWTDPDGLSLLPSKKRGHPLLGPGSAL